MKTPSFYNETIIDSQLMQWHREGHSVDDIIAEAKLTWPEVPEEYIRTTLQIIEKVNKEPSTESEDKPHECMVFLRYLNNQRMKELLRLEKRLDDEDCPMSVHTLYRGFIRDAETYCLKMFAMERDLFLAARKADEKIRVHRQKEAKQKNRLSEMLKQSAQQQDSGKEQPDAASQPNQKQKNNHAATVLGFLLSCCLSFWLSQDLKQQTAEIFKSTHSATESDCSSTPASFSNVVASIAPPKLSSFTVLSSESKRCATTLVDLKPGPEHLRAEDKRLSNLSLNDRTSFEIVPNWKIESLLNNRPT